MYRYLDTYVDVYTSRWIYTCVCIYISILLSRHAYLLLENTSVGLAYVVVTIVLLYKYFTHLLAQRLYALGTVFSFYQWGQWGTKKLISLSEVTELVSGRIGIPPIMQFHTNNTLQYLSTFLLVRYRDLIFSSFDFHGQFVSWFPSLFLVCRMGLRAWKNNTSVVIELEADGNELCIQEIRLESF